jgi:antitoxin component of RelBE/YafQ-DinJ toxin-antitoxin module
MATVKDNRIYVRLSSDVKKEFEMVAAYQGLTPSAMLHSFIVKTVREAKEQSPQIFKGADAEETENKSAKSENPDKTITLDEAKADDKKKNGKKKNKNALKD